MGLGIVGPVELGGTGHFISQRRSLRRESKSFTTRSDKQQMSHRLYTIQVDVPYSVDKGPSMLSSTRPSVIHQLSIT